MADRTAIEWTDATWNPITGCSVVSPGCKHCYAMKLAGTRLQHHPSRAGLTTETKAGPVWNGKVKLNGEWLAQPLLWKRPRRIFVCAHGDLFHEHVPDRWIDWVFGVMALSPQHQFQVLTKRADRLRSYLDGLDDAGGFGRVLRFSSAIGAIEQASGLKLGPTPVVPHPLPNVWLGVSVEDQAAADLRVPDLLMTNAALRFLSCEPLLGPVDLRRTTQCDVCRGRGWYLAEFADNHGTRCHACRGIAAIARLGWVIVGGESGSGARPMHPDWVRSLRDQCAAASVPFFFKQWGEWAPTGATGADRSSELRAARGPASIVFPDGVQMGQPGKKAAGRNLDGLEHNGMPEAAA